MPYSVVIWLVLFSGFLPLRSIALVNRSKSYNMKNKKTKVAVLGPLPPAVGGICTNIMNLFISPLKTKYNFFPFRTGSPMYGTNRYFKERAHFKFFRFIKSLFHYMIFLFRYSPDIVHINTSFCRYSFWRDTFYLIISKIFGKNVLLQIHGGCLDEFQRQVPPLLNRFVNKILKAPEQIIVLCSMQKKPFEDLCINNTPKIVPNMINAIKFNRSTNYRNHLGIPLEHTVVLFVAAHFYKEKGVWEVLNAVPLVTNRYKDVQFIFVGGGKEEDAMHQFCRQIGRKKYVKFTGHVFNEDIIKIYLSADIFVLPTYYSEGFPIVILEAMAAGLPVISTPIRAIPEIIEDGVNGFLIQPKDPVAVAEKIIQLIEDKTLRTTIRENNLKKVREKYDLEPVARTFEDIYCQITSR